ncbi:hypothetical protein OF829_20430 [Sphingomonas sp. LB-2]|uniref:hypothetical protein n=1 Tax=Sphingomonas caeni TaxID=2984949 RepID=UPI002231DE2E|nr:hypothetical protein [Sphingomonas caeni]MCW3849610.1 hypothetical protein [Sphingomonas caeni]
MPVMQSAGGNGAVTVRPNAQASIVMDDGPRTVTVTNISAFDGDFICVWLYATAASVTPLQLTIGSEASLSLRPPPPDSNNNSPRTLVIFNTSGIELSVIKRSN